MLILKCNSKISLLYNSLKSKYPENHLIIYIIYLFTLLPIQVIHNIIRGNYSNKKLRLRRVLVTYFRQLTIIWEG